MPSTAIYAEAHGHYYRLVSSQVGFAVLVSVLLGGLLCILYLGVLVWKDFFAPFALGAFGLLSWLLGCLICLEAIGWLKLPDLAKRTLIITPEGITERRGRTVCHIPFEKIRLYAQDTHLSEQDKEKGIAIWGNGHFLLIPNQNKNWPEMRAFLLTRLAHIPMKVRTSHMVSKAYQKWKALKRAAFHAKAFGAFIVLIGVLLTLSLLEFWKNTYPVDLKRLLLAIVFGCTFLCLELEVHVFYLLGRARRLEAEVLPSLTYQNIPFLLEQLDLFSLSQQLNRWPYYGAREALARIAAALPQNCDLVLPARSYLRIYTLLNPKRAKEWKRSLKNLLDAERIEDRVIIILLTILLIILAIAFLVLAGEHGSTSFPDISLDGDWSGTPATLNAQEVAFQDRRTRLVLLQLLSKVGPPHAIPVVQSLLTAPANRQTDSALAHEAESCLEAMNQRLNSA